jgi:hypothetical protein
MADERDDEDEEEGHDEEVHKYRVPEIPARSIERPPE